MKKSYLHYFELMSILLALFLSCTKDENATPLLHPVVGATADGCVVQPSNSVLLKGTAYDFDGHIVSVQWTKKTGPGSYTLVSPANDTTLVKDLTPGNYVFQITATDDDGLTSSGQVAVSVFTKENDPCCGCWDY